MTLGLYFTGRLLKNFLLALVVTAILFFIIDSIETFKMLAEPAATPMLVLSLFWAKLKVITFQTMPLGFLLSVVITMGTLEMRSEILAAQAGCVNPAKFVLFAALMALPVAGAMAWMQECVVPESSRLVDEIVSNRLGRYGGNWWFFYKDQNWFKGHDGNLFRVSSVDSKAGRLEGVTVYTIDPAGYISRIITADTAAPEGDGRWLFKNVEKSEFDASGGMKSWTGSESSIPLSDRITDFKVIRGRPQQFTYNELIKVIEYRKSVGIETRRYETEKFLKISNPLSVIFIAIAGATCIYIFQGGVSIVRYIIHATVLSFIYWVTYSIGASGAETGSIPAVVAAWMADGSMLLIFIGVWSYRRHRPV